MQKDMGKLVKKKPVEDNVAGNDYSRAYWDALFTSALERTVALFDLLIEGLGYNDPENRDTLARKFELAASSYTREASTNALIVELATNTNYKRLRSITLGDIHYMTLHWLDAYALSDPLAGQRFVDRLGLSQKIIIKEKPTLPKKASAPRPKSAAALQFEGSL